MKKSVIGKSVAVLLACISCVLTPAAQAAMVTTQQAITTHNAQVDRDKVKAFLERATVQDKLRAMGVQSAFAKVRVDALSDQEVAALAQRIDRLPAGGNLSQNDLIIILLIAILVAIAV